MLFDTGSRVTCAAHRAGQLRLAAQPVHCRRSHTPSAAWITSLGCVADDAAVVLAGRRGRIVVALPSPSPPAFVLLSSSPCRLGCGDVRSASSGIAAMNWPTE